MLTSSFVRYGCALAALCALGCSSIEPDETPGELGNGAFRYVCVGDDATCPENGAAQVFPSAIARSARFDVTYQLFEDGSDAQVSSASSKMIEVSGSAFRALESGTAALLARRTVDGVTVDFTHLSIEEVSEIEVRRASGSAVSLVMAAGSLQQLRAEPLDENESVLAGAIAFEWQSSDTSVLKLETTGGSRMDVRAVAPGTASLSVVHGELSESFVVEVTP